MCIRDRFWADFGTQVAIVNGERRSSLIVDPPQGRVPELRPDAQKLVSAADRRGYDGPEQRPLGERCLLAFGNASGPVSYTHLRAHDTPEHLVCRLLLEKKK